VVPALVLPSWRLASHPSRQFYGLGVAVVRGKL
jgi:hypothetical protein